MMSEAGFISRFYSFTTTTDVVIVTDDNYEPNDFIAEAFDLSDWDGLNLSNLDGEGVAVYNDPDYYRIDGHTVSLTSKYIACFRTLWGTSIWNCSMPVAYR